MSRVEVEPRGTKVMLRKLKRLQSEVENPEAGLEAIGDVLVKSTVQRFWKSEGPTGRPWKRSKLAKRKRRRTLVRTGDLRDSIRYAVGKGQVGVGTDILYGVYHQQGGPIDAEYQAKHGKTTAPLKLPKLPGLAPPDATNLARSAAAAARRRAVQKRQAKARKVRLPARRFLGVSKRDRQRSLEVMLKALEGAMK